MGHTLTLLRHQFWWPGMEDIREYISACTVCARGKASHQPLAGYLRPLLVSQGNSIIQTIIDRFSKSVHFAALPKLPSAMDCQGSLLGFVCSLCLPLPSVILLPSVARWLLTHLLTCFQSTAHQVHGPLCKQWGNCSFVVVGPKL